MRRTVVELEEGSLTLTIAETGEDPLRIATCFRMPLNDIHGVVLGNTLKALLAEIPEDFGEVHVVLGERRIQHFVAVVPALGQEEVAAFVTREALRVAGLQPGETLLARARFLGKRPGRKMAIGTTAVAKSIWEPLAKAFAESGLQVRSLHSIEECIGMALERELPERTAVLEYGGGKARFVLFEAGAPAQVRRFLVPGVADGEDSAVLAAQLAMEVARTIEYLKEIRCAPPKALVVSHRIAVAEGELDLFQGEIETCSRFAPRYTIGDAQAAPGMATLGLLRSLAKSAPARSLLDGVTIELPSSPLKIAAAGLAVALSIGCGTVAAVEHGGIAAARAELEVAYAQRQRLEGRLAELSAPAPAVEEATPERTRIAGILAGRRPCSRLLAEVSNLVPAGVLLDEIQFASDRVVVQGTVDAPTRLQALQRLSELAEALRRLGYVASDGKEDVTNVEDSARRLRFRFGLRWRAP